MKIIIILPTYNEKENIAKIIPALQEEILTVPHDVHILVVDGTSPDGTAEAVRNLQKRNSNLHLISGKRAGIGKAYLLGMRYALDELGAEAVMEMDADLSHDPHDVPRLVRALDTYDFAIGSRYVSGGVIPASWPLLRKLNSRWGNIFARIVTGAHSVRDCTSGFRAINANILRAIGLDTIGVSGHCFQIQLLHRAVIHGARIVEIPVVFTDRTAGKSKLMITDVLEFVIHGIALRFGRTTEFRKEWYDGKRN